MAFTLPIFLIAMSEMIPGNPLFRVMALYYWNWIQLALSIPVVFYATWMFFERAYRSIVTGKTQYVYPYRNRGGCSLAV